MKKIPTSLFFGLALGLAAGTCEAKEVSWNAASLLNPNATTNLWGISPDAAMSRFHLRPRAPSERTPPESYLTGGLEAYWKAPESTAAFNWVDAGSKTWLVFYQDRLFGVVATERMDDWHHYLGSMDQYHGPGDTLQSIVPDASTDTPRVLRGNRWKIHDSWITFFKAESLPPQEWSDPETGVFIHWEFVEPPKNADLKGPHALHRLHNSLDLPFYIAIFDAKTLAAWRKQARNSQRK